MAGGDATAWAIDRRVNSHPLTPLQDQTQREENTQGAASRRGEHL
jgi:hypothetical protein